MKRCITVLVVLFLAFPPFLMAQGSELDKTLSPYFFVKGSTEEGVEALPLRSTSAEVKIAGIIADVSVTQLYKNEGNSPIEAIYVFPGSTRAAVYGMKMTIGERVRIAKIQERREAKRTYEKAKASGKSASLLEQERPNVFKMSVANIMPGDEIKVELRYTEALIPTDDIYEFTYPTVVGPRYSNQPAASAPESEQWIQSPFLKQGEKPVTSFDIRVVVNTPVPLQEIASTSHTVDVDFSSPKQANVALAASEHQRGNKDFILRYRLQGETIQSGVLLTEAEGEKFFLLMAEPPARIAPESIPPRDYVFIVDVSGSMMGFPIEVEKKLIRGLISALKPTDTFNMLFFAGASDLLSPEPLPATAENIERAIRLLNLQQGAGGTELLPALKRAFALPLREGVSRSFIISTDGYVTVERESQMLTASSLGRANVFSFGIGTSVNRFLIEALAAAGRGEPFIVTNQAEAERVVPKLTRYIESPVLTNIEVSYDGFAAYDVVPQSIPDLFAKRPLVLFGKWRGAATGKIRINGMQGTGTYHTEIPLAEALSGPENGALRYLWARDRIRELSDLSTAQPSEELQAKVTELGLTYNLLTKYTSFVAVDDVVRNHGAPPTTVKQPLPLPEGVSNSAVGEWGQIGTGPEPSTWALLSILLLISTWFYGRRVREL